MPHAVGKAPRGASDKDRNELLQSLTAMVRDACAAIPDDQSIEFLDTNVSGSTDAYERFAQYHDSEISTAILGHSAGATATPGRLGGDDLALQVRADIVDNDAAMVADTMNTLIRYIHELNPSLGEKRPEFILYDPKDIDKVRAERDSMLLNTGKIRLTKKYFVDNTEGATSRKLRGTDRREGSYRRQGSQSAKRDRYGPEPRARKNVLDWRGVELQSRKRGLDAGLERLPRERRQGVHQRRVRRASV